LTSKAISLLITTNFKQNYYKVMRHLFSVKSFLKVLFLQIFLFASLAASAEDAASAGDIVLTWEQVATFTLSIVIVFLLFVVVYLFYLLLFLVRALKGEDVTKPIFSFKGIDKILTNAVPIEREAEIEFHHEYDGIRELDNILPPWWKYMFYATIVFAVVYLFYFHVSKTGDLQAAEYTKEMAAANKQKEAYMKLMASKMDENSVKLLTDKKNLELGKTIFSQNCSACHGKLGEGGVGPNLTDKYWIHGGGIKNVFKTIKHGVPEKGMKSWQGDFSPPQIQQVASYIISLEGSNPPNPKAPQGDLFEDVKISQK